MEAMTRAEFELLFDDGIGWIMPTRSTPND